jgi:hypothetical protein
MKKIYVGMSSPTGKFEPFAWLIKIVESRPYDHAYIRIQEPVENEYVIFQASKEMVNLYNKDIWQSLNTPLKEYEIDITDDQYAVLWNFIFANLGIPYSLLEDFGILLMKIFGLTKNIFDNGMSAEFCSELCANVCKILGIQIEEQSSSIDPSMLDSILSAKGFTCSINPKF